MSKNRLSYLSDYTVRCLMELPVADYSKRIKKLKKEILDYKGYMHKYVEMMSNQHSWNSIEYLGKMAKEAHTSLRKRQQCLLFIKSLNNKFHLGKH